MKPKIAEVFTPRSSSVNLKTYVPRLSLETALIRSVQGSMHSLLFGESGNGKSWLYKKVFEQHGYYYKVANCANASRLKSLTSEIVNTLGSGSASKIGYTENKEATVRALVADGKLAHQNQFTIQQDEPLLASLTKYRSQIGRGDAILVIDNLESIFGNQDLMNELADIIILLDDPRYAAHQIKFLLVGVPNGVLHYFATTKNLESVSNRLQELPKVDGMDVSMVRTLVATGFNSLLKVGLSQDALKAVTDHIHHCTMGVAQRVQEYCEQLAYCIEDSRGGYDSRLLHEADLQWLRMGLRQAYTVVESHLNSKRTTIARRNQVVYCIGHTSGHQLDTAKIVEKIAKEFPGTAKDSNMGVGTILSELAGGETPLLTKNPRTSEYRVVDPRYTMSIRLMLRKQPDGSVLKVGFRM